MSEMPTPSGTTTQPCERCGCSINDEIMADSPDCPHGWVSLEDMSLADIKALFAVGAPEFSLDPMIEAAAMTERPANPIPTKVLHDLDNPSLQCGRIWSGDDHRCSRPRGHFGACICSCGESR